MKCRLAVDLSFMFLARGLVMEIRAALDHCREDGALHCTLRAVS